MASNSGRKEHHIYAVTRNGKQSFWQPIGAAWVHGDGEGFNLKLEYLPLNDAEIVVRKPKADLTETAANEFAAADLVATG
jgi:hypothetical protein